ncbi:MAG TPA: MlaD family protein [Nocardioidaceae bacterium]|nr:MlaD family protein [Nocardioidaceae bacterium]
MRYVQILRRNSALATVLTFATACVAGFVFLWTQSGGSVPGLTESNDYRLAFTTDDIKNLAELGDVKIAGVKVGKVESTELADGQARVVLSIQEGVAPLHEGATVRIGVKSLVGSSYIDVVDGGGAAIESGETLADQAVVPAVDVDELLSTLDAPTRKSLSAAVQSLAKATGGTKADLDKIMTGLGRIGEQGYTAVDALAAQSKDLQALTREATILLQTLDTGQGQIASLVADAQRLTSATASKRDAVEETVRSLPGLLSEVEVAASKLRELSGPLAPIAADLRKAAPDLNQALLTLPATTDDLRGLLPSLDGTLDEAPATLSRVPAFGSNVSSFVPDADTLFRDLDPMLGYLSPYGLDLGAMFANFGASFDTLAEDGIRPIRLTATAEGLRSIKGVPVNLPPDPFSWTNPYPAPHTADEPAPFRGDYPRVQRIQ